MPPKSRRNYPVQWCGETKCLNRDKRCNECVGKRLRKLDTTQKKRNEAP